MKTSYVVNSAVTLKFSELPVGALFAEVADYDHVMAKPESHVPAVISRKKADSGKNNAVTMGWSDGSDPGTAWDWHAPADLLVYVARRVEEAAPESFRARVAAQCLAAMLAGGFEPVRWENEGTRDAMARHAVAYADALLIELQK